MRPFLLSEWELSQSPGRAVPAASGCPLPIGTAPFSQIGSAVPRPPTLRHSHHT